jgi:asparagine synthetase B (glutamine-hydrolysing)
MAIKNMWLITNSKTICITSELKMTQFPNYSFHTDEDSLSNIGKWYLSGHIFPRNSNTTSNFFNSYELLEHLSSIHSNSFINHIKGNFIIARFEDDGFKIYSDHFAISKFFIWYSGDSFIISNNLRLIAESVCLIPSPENMAVYALTYHFTGGKTLFKDVYHNEPGQVISYSNGKLNFSNHWEPSSLLSLPKQSLPIESIKKSLHHTVSLGLKQIRNNRISLSLTGGADTRNLLALFLSQGIKPHLYTYGNPLSADCLKATAIAKGLNLEHSVYDIQMDESTFESYARKITILSGGLASIHRVHRLMSVEKEKNFANYMFLGTLGGEFIKGVSEDDYIVPSIVYNRWRNEILSKEQLVPYLHSKYINSDSIDLGSLLSFLNKEPYMQGNVIHRKHNSLSYITAHLHDAQDVNLYRTAMDEVFTPFLDVDYLNLIFSSQYTFDQKEVIGNKYIERINNPVYGSEFLNATYKPLLKFLYSGDHKPSDVLFNKYYAAIAKAIRQKTRPKYPANFPLGNWMQSFVEKNLQQCSDHPVIANTFRVTDLIDEFSRGNHKQNEAYWLKFTNPIMMRFIIEEFTK